MHFFQVLKNRKCFKIDLHVLTDVPLASQQFPTNIAMKAALNMLPPDRRSDTPKPET